MKMRVKIKGKGKFGNASPAAQIPAGPVIPADVSNPFVARSSSGMALVIVLGMLMLVLILVVAFFSSVSVELQSAKRYSSGADARALADSAVSLVISQIQDATATPQLAWASQPGMIRTYDNTGAMTTAYKLYSSGTLRVTGTYDPSAEVPAGWASDPVLFTDLNKPVAVGGANHYPILDPAAVAANVSGGTALAGALPAIEGCFLDTTNAAVATSATQTNPVPMPVQWMYVLESGALAAMNPSTKRVAGATDANPIVGRIAFWTDDETSKININTASEGTFWDRPWADSPAGGYERRLAESIPVQNEFQRYPGHPAMTSLSVVFPDFGGTGAAKESIYDVIPRLGKGGSTQGTVTVTRNSPPIVPDNQRLFASVDEFLFSATGLSGSLRQVNPNGLSGTLSVSDLERTRFFLTANSRAPEVNQFNKPRVTLWPLQANTADVSNPAAAENRSAKDKLIAFCSTIGNIPYYFQRYNTFTSPGQDPIPSSQSPTMDWDLIPRNQALYAYLQHLTGLPVPGLGGALGSKYPQSRNQILTQMWDLTRSMVNTFNTGELPNYFYTPFDKSSMIAGQGQVVPLEPPNGTKGFGRFPTITEAALIMYAKGPLTVTGTMPAGGTLIDGSGTTVFASGTYFDRKELQEGQSTIRITGTNYTIDHESPEPRQFGAVLILEPFNPTPGAPPWTANVRYVVEGLENLNIGFPAGPLVNMVTSIDSSYNTTASTGLEANLQKPVRHPKTLGPTDGSNPDPAFYPFYSEFTHTGTTMNFSGGPIVVKIYQGSNRALDDRDLVQTINLSFPDVQGLPLPQMATESISLKGSGTTTLYAYNRDFKKYSDYNKRTSRLVSEENYGRWGVAEDGQHRPLPLVISASKAGDTVRSVEARYGGDFFRGDFRLIAGRKVVPESYFEGHGEKDPSLGGSVYSGTSVDERLVHNLTLDNMPGNSDQDGTNGFYVGAGSTGDHQGKLVNEANYMLRTRGQSVPGTGNKYRDSTRPVAARGLQGAFMKVGGANYPGDWDTGPGTRADGPYVNMPDQASATAGAGTDNLYYAKGGYINSSGIVESGASYSPNRQISSAVAFGSLPSVIDPVNPMNSQPWRTLLFGKHPAAGDNHPGFGVPLSGPPYTVVPDHAFLDLFTMPIVEPYAISEPFSTAGKVNMNCQIVPFTFLTRTTGVRAVLKATQMMAIPHTEGQSYKYSKNGPTPTFRYHLNLDETTGTLKGFQDRFAKGDIFRSATEICDISLVPSTRASDGQAAPGEPSYDTMESWWNDYKLTGDNVREGPYGHIYPRLTTKSNTFTVHVMAQSINKSASTPADEFVEGKDQITGEFRGSFLIERYLDPNADSLIDANGNATNELDPNGMVGPYKFRVVNSKKFAP